MDVKVNTEEWSQFSADVRDAAERFLKKRGILAEDDTIVEEDGQKTVMELLGTVEDCIDVCIPVANAAFVACMQAPGADSDKCFEARADAFYACMDECQKR